MTLPDDLTTTTITGTFLDCAGHALDGSLTISPSTDVTDATGAVVIPMAERVYVISGQGTITTDALVATDNETISPTGWTYELQLQIAGLAPKIWSILLPHSADPVDISGITPVVPQSPVYPAYGGGSGSVTTVSVASANGFAGTVANSTTTPALTLSTSVTGLLKGNGTAVSAAVSGTDYAAASAVTAEASRAEAAEAALLPLAGGTMSGAIAMGSHKVTGLTNGSSAQDAAAFGQTPAGGTTVTVGQGGTGDTSLTAYAPLAGGTTSTGALQQCTTGMSTSGNVLTSNGSSALPSFQAPSGGSGGAAVSTATYGTASETLNAASFGAFLITLSGTPTFTFSGATGGTECSFTLYLKQPATGSTFYTPVWPGSVKWQDAVAPTLTAANSATDILVFASPDGGTTWYGSLAGANY